MLFRFSLYGFLKNQRYFEPFLVLALLEKGMSFFAIGGLIAFRELATNLFEIPSGSIADLLGRRRAMLVSFGAYLLSFVLFWLAQQPVWLWPAMLLFSVGEAFRTGTHKAMIFEWLRQQGRTSEKTKVYGHTRSWSKFGSAISVVIGSLLVLVLDSYSAVFVLSAVPTALNLINLASYPSTLEGTPVASIGIAAVLRHSQKAIAEACRRPRLRRLMAESMSFEGVFHAGKDFLQPLLATTAVLWFATHLAPALGATGQWSELQRSTLLIAPVYLGLHLMSAFASRQAHRFVHLLGDDEARAARCLWSVTISIFLLLLFGELGQTAAISILAFVLLHVLQNLWRPILISRFDHATDHQNSAVTLSVESQARRLATMLLAPLFGLLVDACKSSPVATNGSYWPIAVVGCVLAVAMRVTARNATV